jgi:hypothetical protein
MAKANRYVQVARITAVATGQPEQGFVDCVTRAHEPGIGIVVELQVDIFTNRLYTQWFGTMSIVSKQSHC